MNANHPDTLSMNYLINIITSCSLVISLLSIPLISSSQESARSQESEGIEGINVTAQQIEQNLQDLPISITDFTSETIEKFMVSDVGEYLIRSTNASFSTDG